MEEVGGELLADEEVPDIKPEPEQEVKMDPLEEENLEQQNTEKKKITQQSEEEHIEVALSEANVIEEPATKSEATEKNDVKDESLVEVGNLTADAGVTAPPVFPANLGIKINISSQVIQYVQN